MDPAPSRTRAHRRALLIVLGVIVVVFGLIQLVPYRVANPPVRRGPMPPNYYTWLGMHSNAKLTAQERAYLAAGLTKSLRNAGCGGG